MKTHQSFIKVYPNRGITIELYFSIWHCLSGNKRWFCRIWKDYMRHVVEGESYGNTKFEAFRKATTNLKASITKRKVEIRYREFYSRLL